MNYCIVGKESLPKKLMHLAINGAKVLCLFSDKGEVKKIFAGSVRELNEKVNAVGGELSQPPNELFFENINIGDTMSKTKVSDSIKNLVGGNFSGIRNFKLSEFWIHVQAAAKRTLKKNKSATKQAARLRIGEIALNRIIDKIITQLNNSAPGIKIPFFGKKPIMDFEQYREIISIVVGNSSLLGFDIFSYFGIPMTGLAEVTANCMLEYAYDLASRKIVNWIPQTKIVTEIKSIFTDVENEIGTQNLKDVMTNDEKKSDNSTTQNEISDLINKDKNE
ncbi:MAG TPA: hypothetical protein ENG48_09130 [Candidatus Atribacteria bacterium]|nr:hypothetical protein [Candidatus Atribacteria bacterium]